MILLKGITGFTSIQEYFDIPKISNESIKEATEKFVINNTEYVIVNLIEPTQNSNYYLLNLKNIINNYIVKLIFNSHYKYFSCVEKEVSWCERIFSDLPQSIINNYESFGFSYLSKQILEKKVSANEMKLLANCEKEQIEYWESEIFGEIIYNNYD